MAGLSDRQIGLSNLSPPCLPDVYKSATTLSSHALRCCNISLNNIDTMEKKEKRRIVNFRVARKSFIRQQRSKRKAVVRRKSNTPFVSRFVADIPGMKWKGTDLMVPELMCLDTNYEETVEFVEVLRRLAFTQRRKVRLIFERTKTLKASALLLLLAEIHRCRITRGRNLVTGTYPSNPRIERMLCAIGFFDILKVKNRISVKKTYPMSYIKFASAKRLMEHQARKLRADLLGDKISMEVMARKKLQRAITEAMLNAIQHAYPDGSGKNNPARNRWWLTGTYNRKTKNLVITFCDLGVGIPATVTKLYMDEKIRALFSLIPGIPVDDGQMIMAAMTLGRTRTGRQGRGKGLNDLRMFIDHAQGGELKIFSKRGSYSYSAGGEEAYANYRQPLGGTLIKWSVPIANVTDWSGDDDDGNDEEGY